MVKDFCVYLLDLVIVWRFFICGIRRGSEINVEMGGGLIFIFVWFCLMFLLRCLKFYEKLFIVDMIF